MAIAPIQLTENDFLVISDRVGKAHPKDVRQYLRNAGGQPFDTLIDDQYHIGTLPLRESFRRINSMVISVRTIRITGTHDVCEGAFVFHIINRQESALICQKCHLRVCVPKRIVTYQQLRDHCEKHLSS